MKAIDLVIADKKKGRKTKGLLKKKNGKLYIAVAGIGLAVKLADIERTSEDD